MAQVLTVASILAVVGLLGWRYADRLFGRRHQAAGPAGQDHAIEPQQFEQPPLQGVGAGFPARRSRPDLRIPHPRPRLLHADVGDRDRLRNPLGAQCTVVDGGATGGAITRVIIASSAALSMSNGPAIAAPSVISIAITTPPSS